MVFTDAELVLSADHSEAFHSADLGLLELELLAVDADQFRTNCSQKHLLPYGNVRSAAYHLQRLALTDVKLCDMQVVGIRVLHALQHVGHEYALEPSGYLFYGFNMLDLEAGGSQYFSNFLGLKVELQIIFQPIVRNSHIML